MSKQLREYLGLPRKPRHYVMKADTGFLGLNGYSIGVIQVVVPVWTQRLSHLLQRWRGRTK